MKLPYTITQALFGLCVTLAAQAPQRQQPPEQAEYSAALRIREMPARVKELQRIKAAYPDSTLSYGIDYNLLVSVSRSTDTLKDLLAAQRDVIKSSKLQDRFLLIVNAANMLLEHRKAAEFPKSGLVKAIRDYKAEAMPLLDVPETFAKYPEDIRETAPSNYKVMFEIPLTKALLMNGRAREALNVLNGYKKVKEPGIDYYIALGEAYQKLRRDREALDAYLEAAAANHGASVARAKELHAKINGPDASFEATLAQHQMRRPLRPPPFKAPENWRGKTVLAEVFTGSECGPCVAAAFAFDALKESYPTQYLAVLKYHLPIPNYDPMINQAAKKRQEYYGREIISGTPTAIIDGIKTPSVGGNRLGALTSFNSAKKDIDALMGAASDVTVSASAVISGDDVKVDCEFSKVTEDAEYNVVLVQAEEDFEGGNGIVHHNMVVRDVKTVAPSDRASVTFNIVESEKAADDYITEWGNTASERAKKNSKWPEKRNKINRNNLKAVVFVQDKNTKKVHNAFVADVTSAE
jgi:tetratricopeptide (TPR) repeat protein